MPLQSKSTAALSNLGLAIFKRVTLFLFGLAIVLWLAEPSGAQVAASPDGEVEAGATVDAATLSPEAVDAMVSRLTDEQVRAILLERLNAEATAQSDEPAGADFGELFYHATVGAFSRIVASFAAGPEVLQFQREAALSFARTHGDEGLATLLLQLAIAILIGLAAEWLANRAVSRWLPRPQMVGTPSFSDSVSFLTRRLAREVLGVIVFYVFARIALHQMTSGDLLSLGDSLLLALITFPRLTYSVSRFILSPKYPENRMVNADDATAKFLSRHLVGLAVVAGLSVFAASFNYLSGVESSAAGLGFWFDLIFRLYLIWIVWRAWDGLVSMMRGFDPEVTAWEERAAHAYPAFAITVVIAMWWLLATIVSYGAMNVLVDRGDLITVVLLLLAPAFDTLIRGWCIISFHRCRARARWQSVPMRRPRRPTSASAG